MLKSFTEAKMLFAAIKNGMAFRSPKKMFQGFNFCASLVDVYLSSR